MLVVSAPFSLLYALFKIKMSTLWVSFDGYYLGLKQSTYSTQQHICDVLIVLWCSLDGPGASPVDTLCAIIWYPCEQHEQAAALPGPGC